MKTTTKLITLAGAALMLGGLMNSRADDDAQSMYFHADAGAVFVQSLKLHAQGSSENVDFKPGSRGDIALGFNVAPCLALELETGALWNRIDKIDGESVSDGHTDLFQVPVLANLIYKIDLKNGWTTYFGGGAGVDFGIFDLEPSVNPHFQVISGSESDVTFAYQGQAGIRYALSANSSVDLGYKFFGSFDHHWNVDDVGFKTSAVYSHAVLLSYSLQF